MEQYNLFVYGSLRPNFFNFEKYLEGKTLDIKPAVLKNTLYLLKLLNDKY